MNPALARQHGIECIYQEFNLIDVLSAAENICYGEHTGKLVNQKKMNQIAQAMFDDFGVDINPSTLVRDLTPGHMQIVEIAKAVSKKVRVLILDEPTAPLSVAGGARSCSASSTSSAARAWPLSSSPTVWTRCSS